MCVYIHTYVCVYTHICILCSQKLNLISALSSKLLIFSLLQNQIVKQRNPKSCHNSQLVCSEQGHVGNLQSVSDNTAINHYKSSKIKHLSYKTDMWHNMSYLNLFNIHVWCPCNGIILHYPPHTFYPDGNCLLGETSVVEVFHSPLCTWHKGSMAMTSVTGPPSSGVHCRTKWQTSLFFPIIKTPDEDYLQEEWFHPSSRGL